MSLLANLVASYLFEKSKAILNPTTYHGIYLDDSLVMFKGNKSINEIKNLLEEIQQTVNRAVGN